MYILIRHQAAPIGLVWMPKAHLILGDLYSIPVMAIGTALDPAGQQIPLIVVRRQGDAALQLSVNRMVL